MATAPHTTRSQRAQSILANGGVQARGGSFVVVDQQGSGKSYSTTVDSCTCPDHRYRRATCKHMLAARAAAGVVCCATCGSTTTNEIHYVGGRGYKTFAVCTADKTHTARRID